MMDFNNDSSNFNLAENLRVLRKRMSLSQEELAEKMGLNRGNIASYESGSAAPKICNLVKFSQLFNVSIFDLTHNDLKAEMTYTRAMQRHQNGLNGTGFLAIDQYAEEAKEFEGAIKGMECFCKMKFREVGDLPEGMSFFKQQIEQLNTVAQHLLRSHVELIATIKSRCKEQSNGDTGGFNA